MYKSTVPGLTMYTDNGLSQYKGKRTWGGGEYTHHIHQLTQREKDMCGGGAEYKHHTRRLQPADLVSCIIRGGTANINFVHNNRA